MNPLTHVAIIMDGNGRWGLKHKKSRNAGHKAGLNAIEKIINETIKQKIGAVGEHEQFFLSSPPSTDLFLSPESPQHDPQMAPK